MWRVRQRVVPTTAVPAPMTEIKNTRKLPRISNVRVDKRKEAALVPMQSLEKVTALLGETQSGMKRARSPRTSTTSSGSETPEKPQLASRAASNQSRRRLRQFLEVHEDLTPGQRFLELRAVQFKSAGLYKQSLREFMEWANIEGKRLEEDNEVDDALVGYMNEKFFTGVQAHVEQRLMAGLMSEVPEFSKTGRRTTPRAWRCLRG